MTKGVKILISGEVQGVGMRYTGKKKAEELGLTGYIRNLQDGRVEIALKAEPEKIDKFIDWLKKNSPGRVEKIKQTDFQADRPFPGFEIIY